MIISLDSVHNAVSEALVQASTSYTPDQIDAFKHAINNETNENSKWLLQMYLENAEKAREKFVPLCDDTGIPYVLMQVGNEARMEGNVAQIIKAIEDGVANGLRKLPGRPMAVKGNDYERIVQSIGLYEDSGMLLAAPIRFRRIEGKSVHITVLMLGGGPEIRSKTYRVFHHHDYSVFIEEISQWAAEMAKMLGCTPCVPAIGVGRTHYEASCLMLDAMVDGKFGEESDFERAITTAVNRSNTGPLGIGGGVTALQTFAKIGPQRASGVRIVCLRPGCVVDPRRHTISFKEC